MVLGNWVSKTAPRYRRSGCRRTISCVRDESSIHVEVFRKGVSFKVGVGNGVMDYFLGCLR